MNNHSSSTPSPAAGVSGLGSVPAERPMPSMGRGPLADSDGIWGITETWTKDELQTMLCSL